MILSCGPLSLCAHEVSWWLASSEIQSMSSYALGCFWALGTSVKAWFEVVGPSALKGWPSKMQWETLEVSQRTFQLYFCEVCKAFAKVLCLSQKRTWLKSLCFRASSGSLTGSVVCLRTLNVSTSNLWLNQYEQPGCRICHLFTLLCVLQWAQVFLTSTKDVPTQTMKVIFLL